MREVFSQSLVNAVKNNPKLYLLTGDHGYALFDGLRKEAPDRFINAGVAEQNMVGVAAGLAKAGLLPIVYGLSAFVPVRVLEQIKLDFCYENLPGVFVGDGAGVVYSHLGTSHQSTEDIACLRPLPNLEIVSPADKFEMESCFNYAVSARKPVYLRVGKSDLGDVHSQVPSFQPGEMLQVCKGAGELSFVATGSMVSMALKLANNLFTNASVYSVPHIKPLNEESVLREFSQTKLLITFEEHSVYGGLGSLFAEILATQAKTRVIRLGVNDRFSMQCGSYQYLMQEHGLDFEALKGKIQSFL